ncbi:MAG TPA: methyl-accepting chemotaxis protein [Blastocatellia bacterium]|nr:methyl-accepting chemotaxis protein [Blastocatellia bacterium]
MLSSLERFGLASVRSKILFIFLSITILLSVTVVLVAAPFGPIVLTLSLIAVLTIAHTILASGISRSLLIPVVNLAEASDSLRDGRDAARCTFTSKDEFSSLSASFNLAIDHLFKRVDLERTRCEVTRDEGQDGLDHLQEELIRVSNRERELEQALAEYKSMFDDAPVGYHEIDREGRITRVNNTELRMLGYTAEEMVGKEVLDFVLDKGSRERLAELLSGRTLGATSERTLRRKDGGTVPVLLDHRQIRNAQGEIVGIRTAVQEITALKQAKAELTRERDLLETLLLNVPVGIYFKDTGHRFTRLGKIEAEMLGLPEPSLGVGKTEVDFLDREYAAQVFQDELKVMESGEPSLAKVERFVALDGKEHWLSASRVPIRDDQGRISGIIGVSTDITAQRNMDALIESGLSELLALVSRVSVGDLLKRAVEGDDTLGRIAVALNRMLDNFSQTIAQVKQLGISVSSSATQILASASQMSLGSERQAEEITNTSSAVEEMSASMNHVSRNATASAEAAQRAMRMAEIGDGAVRETTDAMCKIEVSVKRAATEIQTLAKRSSEISEIMNLIDDIASQTNLLSLNAAIQAAHAGEAGLGFSVVAEEIRKLAERSGHATKDVNNLIRTILAETDNTLKAMQQCVTEVQDGTALVEQARLAIKDTSMAVRLSTELIEEIASASEQQAHVTRNVSGAMQVVSSIALQTSAGALQTAETIRSMTDLSERLNEAMSRFRVEDSALDARP